MHAEPRVRISMRLSANRHWLARVTLGLWALQIPLIAFLAPETMT